MYMVYSIQTLILYILKKIKNTGMFGDVYNAVFLINIFKINFTMIIMTYNNVKSIPDSQRPCCKTFCPLQISG